MYVMFQLIFVRMMSENGFLEIPSIFIVMTIKKRCFLQ